MPGCRSCCRLAAITSAAIASETSLHTTGAEMLILVVGGTGMIGSHVAVHLAEHGHQVTVASRRAPGAHSLVSGFPFVGGDYAAGEFGEHVLEGFDAVVFSAGQDIRHVQPGRDDSHYWERVQSAGVPAFVASAKRAGVRRLVQLGSYYHVVMPQLADASPYVRARQLADERSCELADDEFNVCTLNPPSIVGLAPGRTVEHFARLVAWADGTLRPRIPDVAPPGGTNYMSVRSLAEAVTGALLHAEPGASYLLGDENLRYRAYLQTIFDICGSSRRLVEVDRENPLMPDRTLVAGRGNVVTFEPDEDVVRVLGFRRRDVTAMLTQMVDVVRSAQDSKGRIG